MMDTAWIPYGIWFQEFHEFRANVVEILPGLWEDRFKMESFIKMLWTLATFLLMAAYSGNLKSKLVIQEYGDTLNTLEELIKE